MSHLQALYDLTSTAQLAINEQTISAIEKELNSLWEQPSHSNRICYERQKRMLKALKEEMCQLKK